MESITPQHTETTIKYWAKLFETFHESYIELHFVYSLSRFFSSYFSFSLSSEWNNTNPSSHYYGERRLYKLGNRSTMCFVFIYIWLHKFNRHILTRATNYEHDVVPFRDFQARLLSYAARARVCVSCAYLWVRDNEYIYILLRAYNVISRGYINSCIFPITCSYFHLVAHSLSSPIS